MKWASGEGLGAVTAEDLGVAISSFVDGGGALGYFVNVRRESKLCFVF